MSEAYVGDLCRRPMYGACMVPYIAPMQYSFQLLMMVLSAYSGAKKDSNNKYKSMIWIQ